MEVPRWWLMFKLYVGITEGRPQFRRGTPEWFARIERNKREDEKIRRRFDGGGCRG